MLVQTYTSAPFEYRLPGDIPVTFFPLSSYNPYLTTPPRIYGEAWAAGYTSAILINPEKLEAGYQTIWLGLLQDQVHWPDTDFEWYRFNATTGEWLGRIDVVPDDTFIVTLFAQARDGTVYRMGTTTDKVYQCTVDPIAGVTFDLSLVAFDLAALIGSAVEIQAYNIDTALNLLMVGHSFAPYLRIYNLTTGDLLSSIALPGWAVSIMPVDTRYVYVMTNFGIVALIDFTTATVLSTFQVQESFNSFTNVIIYDQLYKRFLAWFHTPEDGTGQNTSIIRGFYPVDQATGITKAVPIRVPRKYRSTPLLTRVFGDIGEPIGGGIVRLTSLDTSKATVTSFPAITDTDGEAIGTIAGDDSGNVTIVASVDVATGIGGTGESAPAPPPPIATTERNPGDCPRLGGYLVGTAGSSPDYSDPTLQGEIAKLDVAVLAFPPGYAGSGGVSTQQVCVALKALNPRLVLVNYSDPFQYPPSYNASAYGEVATMLANPQDSAADAAHRPQWYLFDHSYTPKNTAAGYIASPAAWGTANLVNMTSYNSSNRNLAGQTANQWRASFDALYSTRISLALDGIFADHSVYTLSSLLGTAPTGDFDSPGSAVGTILGDWNRDENSPYPPATHYGHSPPSPANAADFASSTDSAWRTGVADFAAQLRGNMGAGKFVFANLRDWNHGLLGPFFNMVEGGVIEAMIGQADSPETTSFAAMMLAYQNIMVAIKTPQLVIFAHDGDPTDYQDMRYGLCACLMGGSIYGTAYYYHSDSASAGGYSAVNWFDEFDFNLGAPTQSVVVPWQNGVWRRNFQHGIALVNPKGNGTQTVTLERSYTKLTGSQDPTTNDGSTVTSVTLADRDGLILIG
jgi:hypothetical protein